MRPAKPGSRLNRALASCRRVFLLLLVSLTVLVAWMYWQSPGLQTLKPTIEHYIQQELELKELRLGRLSWYWAGFLWLRVDHLDFTSADNKLAFHNGNAAIRLPLASWFGGELAPDLVRLSDGTLDATFSDSGSLALAGQLSL